MGNPNVLGQLLTWSVAAFLLAFLLGIGNRAIVTIVILACLVTLGMTGSRYGLLDGAIALLLVVFMPFTPKRRLSQALLPLVLLPLCVLAIGVVAASNPRTLERFQTLNDPLHTDSAIERFETRWADALDNFSESPFLGRGPAKSIFAGVVVDSEYLGVLEQFGVLGLLAYLAYYLYPLFLIWQGMRSGTRAGPSLEARLPANYLVMRLGLVMIVTALVMNIGMSSFYNQLLQGFLWIWMGLAARAARTIGEANRVCSFTVRTGH
jgi:O-antigen ligase